MQMIQLSKIRSRYLAGLLYAPMFLLTACQKDHPDTVFVDENLQEYFMLFEQEGKTRGVTIDFEKIKVEGFISDALATTISGQCQHDASRPDRLLINRTYWQRANRIEREFLVFHELGHCYLQRSHLDERDSRGRCLSIMHSGSGVCNNAYHSDTRSSYLDELFNPN